MSGRPSEEETMSGSEPPVSFQTRPDRYRHWRMEFDDDVAYLVMDVDEQGGLRPGYELKLNSYDLGVDIELYDAVQRLRFEHPEVRAVVITSGDEKVFCAGANIRMLAAAGHPWKVNFCKFTNETRCGIEDASEHSGQTYIAAVNGTASGGGYEIALACDRILLIDDRSAAVSLPEVSLLGVLPGTGGLTRVVDKRRVRRDRADVFATKPEGVKGRTAVEWGLVDEAVPRSRFEQTVRERARQAATESARAGDRGVTLPMLEPEISADRVAYRHVTAELDGDRVTVTIRAPEDTVPPEVVDADFWPLAMTRELDDLILWLRTNEPERGTWVVKTTGDIDAVLAYEEAMTGDKDWLAAEIRHYYKRTLKRLDVTSRSLVALVEPGSCFAGALLETALAGDRQYMLEGAEIVVTEANFGAFPMANGWSRLASRFHGEDEPLRDVRGRRLGSEEAEELGLVTLALDDIDWDDEIRIALEERASLSPDALTGMEANHRFAGPETMETKIFGRLSAWQNWIFTRPGASGPDGALSKYGTGVRATFDRRRT
ncbi:2,3-epoxybenzoyl-CoA dihydrolase [Actinoallomurus iriomotensis]|nr:2,3-epoxybenzoyl-CoA dihydrolase [Actinoallomurus iriomotensis]